jgi:hypothetical protein
MSHAIELDIIRYAGKAAGASQTQRRLCTHRVARKPRTPQYRSRGSLRDGSIGVDVV